METVWSSSLGKVSTWQCGGTVGEIIHWWVLGGLAFSSTHCSTLQLSVSVCSVCPVEVLLYLSKPGQTGQGAETLLLLQWKVDGLCAASMLLLAKLAFLKCLNTSYCGLLLHLLCLHLLGWFWVVHPAQCEAECSAALILVWYCCDWWLGLFRETELTAVLRSCCVHLLCASCTHSQCLILALVSIYLCLPAWKRIMDFLLLLFVFPGARGGSVHICFYILI